MRKPYYEMKKFLLIIAALTSLPAMLAAQALPAELANAIARIEAKIQPPQIPDFTVDLVEHSGMSPDRLGTHEFRDAFQAALDEIDAQGGGTLLVPHPQGRWEWVKETVVYRLRGGLEIGSNTRILIDPSVRLHFECSPIDYTEDGQGVLIRYEGTTIYGHQPLMRAFNAHDIVIAAAPGHGAMPEISGDGEAWLRWARSIDMGPSVGIREANNAGLPLAERRSSHPGAFFRRPSTLHFLLCRDVLVEGIAFSDSPFWVVHPAFSENLTFRGLLFDCQNVNNDGVDVDSCRNVIIEDTMFNNHDDNVVLKSGRDREGREGVDIAGTELDGLQTDSPYLRNGRLGGPTEDVVARNNVFKGHYAVAIGSEMSGDVRRVYVVNNSAVQPVQMLVFVKSSRARGGIVEDIYVRDLEANIVTRDVIALIPNYDGNTTSPHVPVFRNIHLADIRVNKGGAAITVQGWKEEPIHDITLTDIQIDTLTRDADQSLVYAGVENLVLQNVTVGGTPLDGTYRADATEAPRQQN